MKEIRSARALRALRDFTCEKCGKAMRVNNGSFRTHQKWCGTETEERFWSKVDKHGPNGCWLYMLGRDKWGYGDLRWMGKHIQAHRLAWKLLKGDPKGKDVLHTCHNPPCCNPDHLYLGTDLENARDRRAAGHVGHKYTPINELRYPHLSRRNK